MRYKAQLFLNYIKKMFRSPSRMILTLSGLVLSVMILVSGLVFSETYLRSKTKRLEQYRENAVIQVEGMYLFDLYRDICRSTDYARMDLISNKSYKVGDVVVNGRDAHIYITDICTDRVDVGFLNEELTGVQRFESELVVGRLIEEDDITEQKKVAVIYDTLAEVLFEKKNPIGESLVFPVYELNEELGAMEVAYYQDLKVIGVIRAPQRAEAYFDDKDIGAGEELNVCFPVYIPLSLKIDKDEPDSRIMRVTAYSNKEEYSETAERIERIAAGYREAEYRVDSYFSLYAAAKDELTTARDGIFILAFAMLIISGIAIANTMFFSVKERINEIGIRKSIGADDYDILIQFVFEGAVYGIFSGIIGVLMCMVFDPIIYLVLIKRAIWLPGVPLCFEYSVVCLAVSIAVLISTLASVIPAIYASRIKIAEAIRFE